MCSINAHLKKHKSSYDDGRCGGGCIISSKSTTEALYLLVATIDFIDFWLKALEHNFIECCNFYSHHMDLLFQKTPVKLPNQPGPREKLKSLLHAIGGVCYVDKFGQNLPPPNKRKLGKNTKMRRTK